jgi:hypothetical protein
MWQHPLHPAPISSFIGFFFAWKIKWLTVKGVTLNTACRAKIVARKSTIDTASRRAVSEDKKVVTKINQDERVVIGIGGNRLTFE